MTSLMPKLKEQTENVIKGIIIIQTGKARHGKALWSYCYHQQQQKAYCKACCGILIIILYYTPRIKGHSHQIQFCVINCFLNTCIFFWKPVHWNRQCYTARISQLTTAYNCISIRVQPPFSTPECNTIKCGKVQGGWIL